MLVALVLAACCVLLGLVVHADLAYFVFSLLLSLPLVWRRRHAVVCCALVLCAALVQWLTVRDSTGALPADLAVPLAVHAAAAYGPRWVGRAASPSPASPTTVRSGWASITMRKPARTRTWSSTSSTRTVMTSGSVR